MADAPLLAISDLTIALPAGAERPEAVRSLSLEIGPGEVLCLVGESGSGKSMTAAAIAGLLPPGCRRQRGRVLLNGENLTDLHPAAMRSRRGAAFGMVFQEPMSALNPAWTVGTQLREAITAHRPLADRDLAAETDRLLQAVNLDPPQGAAYPHQLSGGQRQRVTIAMAIANDPPLLIADEPTTALDVTTAARILDLLRDLRARRGTALLFITHDFGIVADLADRVAVMSQGEIVEQGPAGQVITSPKHSYTRMLIESVPSLDPPERPPVPGDRPVALTVSGLCKSYREPGLFGGRGAPRPVVRDASLEIRRGETLALVGESGSGKTTLARCLLRLTEPDSGHFAVEGEPIQDLQGEALRQARRRIQMVFQDPVGSLNPRRRIGQSIAEGPVNFGIDRASALDRARETLDLVGLDKAAADRFPAQFSGGQRQRIGLARALALNPAVLVADEPVSALDVSVQARILALIDELKDRLGLALLFITHDLRVAARLADRVAVMEAGRIIEEGPASQILSDPQETYTRSLIAAAPGRGRI